MFGSQSNVNSVSFVTKNPLWTGRVKGSVCRRKREKGGLKPSFHSLSWVRITITTCDFQAPCKFEDTHHNSSKTNSWVSFLNFRLLATGRESFFTVPVKTISYDLMGELRSGQPWRQGGGALGQKGKPWEGRSAGLPQSQKEHGVACLLVEGGLSRVLFPLLGFMRNPAKGTCT